jgi:hypothetical protein
MPPKRGRPVRESSESCAMRNSPAPTTPASKFFEKALEIYEAITDNSDVISFLEFVSSFNLQQVFFSIPRL